EEVEPSEGPDARGRVPPTAVLLGPNCDPEVSIAVHRDVVRVGARVVLQFAVPPAGAADLVTPLPGIGQAVRRAAEVVEEDRVVGGGAGRRRAGRAGRGWGIRRTRRGRGRRPTDHEILGDAHLVPGSLMVQ